MAPTVPFNAFETFVSRSLLVFSAVAFLIVASFVKYLLNRQRGLDLPVIGSADSEDWGKDLIRGTLKVRIHTNVPKSQS